MGEAAYERGVYHLNNSRPRRLPERLSREEVAQLLAQPSKRYPTGIRNRALIRLLYRSGLRCNEALNLKVRDIDMNRGEVRVVEGKGKRDRRVWIDTTTIEVLDRWKAIRPKSDWFFCTLKGARLDDRYVRELFNRLGEKAGIGIRVHPHLLRHTYASELLEDGFSILEVQRMLGHAHISTTAIYLHTADENLRRRLLDRGD